MITKVAYSCADDFAEVIDPQRLVRSISKNWVAWQIDRDEVAVFVPQKDISIKAVVNPPARNQAAIINPGRPRPKGAGVIDRGKGAVLVSKIPVRQILSIHLVSAHNLATIVDVVGPKFYSTRWWVDRGEVTVLVQERAIYQNLGIIIYAPRYSPCLIRIVDSGEVACFVSQKAMVVPVVIRVITHDLANVIDAQGIPMVKGEITSVGVINRGEVSMLVPQKTVTN